MMGTTSNATWKLCHDCPARALVTRFPGLVLEVELEHDDTQASYYEIELLQGNGSTLTLKVDARSLQVLKQKVED